MIPLCLRSIPTGMGKPHGIISFCLSIATGMKPLDGGCHHGVRVYPHGYGETCQNIPVSPSSEFRVYPHGYGETDCKSVATVVLQPRVYPHGYGETICTASSPNAPGLSPRVWGNRLPCGGPVSAGSIPTGMGKPRYNDIMKNVLARGSIPTGMGKPTVECTV